MKKIYGNKLKELREQNELTQYKVSDMLGFQKRVYGNFEREETIIPIKYLNTLCNYFNVSIDYIFKFINIKKYDNCRNDLNLTLIRKRLKELRNNEHLSQENLANSISVSPSTISEYEREAKIIATPFLYDICKKYNISADYLLGKIDSPKYLNK